MGRDIVFQPLFLVQPRTPRKMKKMDIFCASPASTAICTSLGHRSVGRNPHRHADHPVHRLPHGGDLPRMIKTQVPIPCTSYQLAITPRPKSYYDDQKRIGELGRRKSSADDRDPISLSPSGSSRYLLSDKPFMEPVSEPNRSTALIPVQPARDSVVVLRVSLHCKGCESKVRKHLSRMEGVRSFSIDFEKKKVTVKGELNPVSVLASVSRVMKTAQLVWP